MLAEAIKDLPQAQAKEYLRRILEHLFGLDADSYVRLAVNSGSPPHYCIEMVMDAETGQAQNFGEFSGKTHRELTRKQSREAIWTDEITHRPSVQTLIDQVRKQKRQ